MPFQSSTRLQLHRPKTRQDGQQKPYSRELENQAGVVQRLVPYSKARCASARLVEAHVALQLTLLPCLVSVTRSTSSPSTPAHDRSPAATQSSANRIPTRCLGMRSPPFSTRRLQRETRNQTRQTRPNRPIIDGTLRQLAPEPPGKYPNLRFTGLFSLQRACRMSWCLVIAILLGTPAVAPCAAAVYGGSHRPNPGFPLGAESGAITSDSAAAAELSRAGMGSGAAGDEGGAEALRRFASARAMKTGTTIAGVVFEVGRCCRRGAFAGCAVALFQMPSSARRTCVRDSTLQNLDANQRYSSRQTHSGLFPVCVPVWVLLSYVTAAERRCIAFPISM